MKYLQIIIVLILLNGSIINAQHFLGGNIYMEIDTLNNDFFIDCYADLYYTVQDSVKDSIVVDLYNTYGDFPLTFHKVSLIEYNDDLFKVKYKGIHNENIFGGGNQTIFRYSENIDAVDINNISDSNYTISSMVMFVNENGMSGFFLNTKRTPNFDNEIFQINHQGDSSYLNYQSTNSYTDSIKYTLNQAWTLGLMDTSTTPNDFILTDDGLLKWDTILTGKYLIKVGILQYKFGGVYTATYSAIIVDTDNTDSLNVNTYFQPTSRLDVDIFPNPTSDLLQITTQKPLNEIQLYNALGQKVHQQQGLQQTEVRINVGDLPKGMYIVRVRQGENWGSEQLVIQ